MFSLFRTVLIIAAIFYYSPVRQSGDATLPFGNLFGGSTQRADPKTAPAEPPARLETMWQALPDSAKQAVIDKILSTSGLGEKPIPASDTLNSSDRQFPWGGEAKRPSR